MKTNVFYSRLCGKLLGDGSFTKQLGRQPRFQFNHRKEDFEWANYCYLHLREFIPLNQPSYTKLTDPRVKKGFTERYMVQSKTSRIITELDELWYPNRKKHIPYEFIEKYLNEEALTWWYQDDGHLKIAKGIPKKIILSTDSFTTQENNHLQIILKNKFSLNFTLDSQNRLIIYDQLQIYYFNRIVSSYLQKCMNRKAINYQPIDKSYSLKRTTIRLSIDIPITKPTAEINQRLSYLPYLYERVLDKNIYMKLYLDTLKGLPSIPFKKTYQILINENHWPYLENIRKRTGLNYSQIAYLCFILFD